MLCLSAYTVPVHIYSTVYLYSIGSPVVHRICTGLWICCEYSDMAVDILCINPLQPIPARGKGEGKGRGCAAVIALYAPVRIVDADAESTLDRV